MGHDTDRTDISSEPSPGAEEHDNLGAEDNKGEPRTVVPTDDGDVSAEETDED